MGRIFTDFIYSSSVSTHHIKSIIKMGNQPSSNWQDNFNTIDSSTPVRRLIHKQTSDRYQAISLFPPSPQDASTLMAHLQHSINQPSKYLQPLHSYNNKRAMATCTGKSQIDVLYRSGPNLQQFLTHRRVKNQGFMGEEIEYVIVQVAEGLRVLKERGQEHAHINLANVIVQNGQIKLRDPLLARESSSTGKKLSKIQYYPSPQKLYTLFDTLSNFEEHTSDLFSLGILALQLYYPQQNLLNLYKHSSSSYLNCSIDLNQLQTYLSNITNPTLKRYIGVLTEQQSLKRRNIYEEIIRNRRNWTNLNILTQNPFEIGIDTKPLMISTSTVKQIFKQQNPIQTTTKQQKDSHKMLPPPPTMFGQLSLQKHKVDQYQYPKQPKTNSKIQINGYNPFQPFSLNNFVVDPSRNTIIHEPSINWDDRLSKYPKPQLRLEKISPKYIDSTYRNSFIPTFSAQKTSTLPDLDFHSKKIEEIINFTRQQQQRLQTNHLPITNSQINDKKTSSILQPPNSQATPTNPLLPSNIGIIRTTSIYDQQVKTSIQPVVVPKQVSSSPLDPIQGYKLIEQNKKNEKMDGYVVQQYDIGTRYEGYKENGMRNGHGQFIYKQGSRYKGEWKDNKMEGYGTLYYPNGAIAYEGQWHDDQFDGAGIVYNDNPLMMKGGFDYTNFNNLDEEWVKYEGYLKNDAKQGIGKLYLTNGQIYEGSFLNDTIDGQGEFHRSNNTIIRGQWKQGLLKKIIQQRNK